jgi:uncharacterized membrane protein YheB (UPF0754 family)
MKDTYRKYLQKYYPFDTLLVRKEVAEEGLGFNKFRLSRGKRVFMWLLQISPWICGAGFGVAFLLSVLPGAAGTFYTTYQGLWDALLIVCVSGLIGYSTNYIAIRMLFRPVVRRPIWGQGLIPAQRNRIIHTLALGMHKHVLNQDLIRKRVEDSGLVKRVNEIVMNGTAGLLRDEELRDSLKQLIYESIEQYAGREEVRKDIRSMIDTRIDENVEGGVKRFLLQTYKRYNKEEYEDAIDRIVSNIPTISLEVIGKLEGELNRLAAFIRKNKGSTEEYIMKMFVDVLNRIDITSLLAKQMEHFDEAKLERMVWEATNEQLLYIQYLGTLLGILGGLLIWKTQLMAMIYVCVLIVLYFLDQFLFQLKSKNI